MKWTITILVLVGTICQNVAGIDPKPEQVHIALGTDETEMVVTWNTIKGISGTPVVHFGLKADALSLVTKAETTKFIHDIFTYRALLTGLKPNTKYYYQVGSGVGLMSKVFEFRTIQSGSKWNPRIGIYGDFGLENEQSLPYLRKDIQKDLYDTIFHVGDIAYDLNERDGKQGNDFMNSIEDIAARVPYMTCPGNHEYMANFTHYDARFSMIGDRNHPNHNASLTSRLNNHFWSVDIGPIHFLLFSTEFYYFTEFGWDQIERQYHFLEEDLKLANANRHQRPWIVVMGHKPLYCVTLADNSCDLKSEERPSLRQGIRMHGNKTGKREYGLEELFFRYGVDMQFYGHEHYYARMLPVYNFKVMNGTNPDNPYDNPSGPMHMTTGSAGNRERHSAFNSLRDWVGFHKYDYGYTRMTVMNVSHIVLEQVSDDQKGIVIDKIDLIKSEPKPKWMPLY